MRAALGLFGVFVLISSLLYGTWGHTSQFYLEGVIPFVNLVFVWCDLPVVLERRDELLLLAYGRAAGGTLRLEALDYHTIYLNLIAGTALIAASPGRRLRWKIGWTLRIFIFLWATHIASFFAGGYIAIWDYMGSLPQGAARSALQLEFAWVFPQATKDLCTQLLSLWNVWGRYALCLGMWFFALGHKETLGSAQLDSVAWWKGYFKVKTGAPAQSA